MARGLLLCVAVAALCAAAMHDVSQAQPVPVPVPVPVAPVPAQPAEAGPSTLRLPLGPSEASLDPHCAPSGVSLNLIADIYEGLMQWLPGDSPKLAPCLAANWPKVSEDGLTYTFKLREAKFHNSLCFEEGKGRKLKASDVVASFKRLAALSAHEQHWFWLVKGLIAGLDKYAEDAGEEGGYSGSDETEIEGLSAPDDSTFVLKLKRPFAPILSILAHPACSIIAEEAMNHFMFELSRRAVGTGPYRLNALAAGHLYVLKRFDDYWGEKPEFERVVYAEPVSVEGVMGGHWAECALDSMTYRRHVRDEKLIGPLAKARVELSIAEDVGTWFMSFNMTDAVVGALDADGRGLRRAISLSVDRARMVETCLGSGFGRPAREILPPGCEMAELGGHDEWGAFDLKQAKSVLDQTKFKNGLDPDSGKALSLKLYGAPGEMNRRMADVVKAGLKSLGIELEVLLVDPAEYFEAMDTGEGHLYFSGWFLDYPDPQNIFQLYESRNIGTGQENRNTARYGVPEFDADYAALCRLPSTPENAGKRKSLVQAMSARLLEDRPVVPLMLRKFPRVHSSALNWPTLPDCTFDRVRFIKSK